MSYFLKLLFSLAFLGCLTKLTADPYVVIRGVLKLEGRDCYIVSYSIYDDMGTSDRSDDIRIVSRNAAIGRGCDVGNLMGDNTEDRTISTESIDLPFLIYIDNNEYIDFSLISDFNRVDIEIVDLTGKILFRDFINNYKGGYRHRIYKNSLMSGIYILNIRTTEGYCAVKSLYKF